MYCTLPAPATLALATRSSVSAPVVAPELNDALQTLSAQAPDAVGRQDKLDRLKGVLQEHAPELGKSGQIYWEQLASDDPLRVSDALHRLAFDAEALSELQRQEHGAFLAAELASEIPPLDEATLRELEAGQSSDRRAEHPEMLINKQWFEMMTNLGSGICYLAPCVMRWAAEALHGKVDIHSNAFSRMIASAARFVEKGALSLQGHMGDDELIAAAQKGPLNWAQWEAYRMRRSFPLHAGPSLDSLASASPDVLAMIEQGMPGIQGAPHMSTWAAAMASYHFTMTGNMVNRAMAETQDPKLYARLVQMLSFEVLRQLKARLQVLHGERIQELKAAVAAGKSVVIICNHRSHLDTLVLLLLLEFLQPAFVAKISLLEVPLLGRLIIQGGHATIDPEGGIKSLVAARDFTLEMFGKQRGVVYFAEGTRYPGLRPGIESGLQTFKSGAFWGAQHGVQQGFDVLIQPIFIYGDGLILPKGRVEGVAGKESSIFSALMQGVLTGQSVVADFLAPIDVNELSQRVGTGSELASELSRLTHYTMWQEGARLQATMNRRRDV